MTDTIPGSTSVTIEWQDTVRQFSIAFQLHAMAVLERLVSSAEGDCLAVMLGTRTRDPYAGVVVMDAFTVSTTPSGAFPILARTADHIAARVSDLQPPLELVGIFIVQQGEFIPPRSTDVLPLREMLKDITPIIVASATSAEVMRARTCAWLPENQSVVSVGLEFPVSCRILVQRSFHPFAPQKNGSYRIPRPRSMSPDPNPPLPLRAGRREVPAGAPRGGVSIPGHYGSEQTPHALSPVLPKWAVGAVSVALLGGAGAYYYRFVPVSTAPTSPVASVSELTPSYRGLASSGLGLEVTRKGADIQIHWDLHSERAMADVGNLQIVDGGHLTNIPLDRSDLRAGHVLYVPRSGQTEITMTVMSGSDIAEERVRVILGRLKPATVNSPVVSGPANGHSRSAAGGADSAQAARPKTTSGRAARDLPVFTRRSVSARKETRDREVRQADGIAPVSNHVDQTTNATPSVSNFVVSKDAALKRPLIGPSASVADDSSVRRSASKVATASASTSEQAVRLKTISDRAAPNLPVSTTRSVSARTETRDREVRQADGVAPVSNHVDQTTNATPSLSSLVVSKDAALKRPSIGPSASVADDSSVQRSASEPATASASTSEQVHSSPRPPLAVQEPAPKVITPGKPTKTSPISLPPELRRMIVRKVEISYTLLVDETGRVSAVNLHSQLSGLNAHLAEIGVRVLRTWRFEPARVNGMAVSSEHIIRLHFAPCNGGAENTARGCV